jgi:hypothetical protein
MVSTRRRHERDATSTPPPLATAPSTPTSPVSSSSKRQSHPRDRRLQVLKRNARSVDENIDRELVGILLSAKRFLKFTDACTGLEHILGNPGSNLRKRVWNRRAKLLAIQKCNQPEFFELAREFGLTTDIDDTTTNSSPNESPQSTSSASNKESSESLEASPARSKDRRREPRPAVNTTPTSTTTSPTSKMSSAGKGNGMLMACVRLCLLSYLNFLCFLLI